MVEEELDFYFLDELSVHVVFLERFFLDGFEGDKEIGCFLLGEVDVAEFSFA